MATRTQGNYKAPERKALLINAEKCERFEDLSTSSLIEAKSKKDQSNLQLLNRTILLAIANNKSEVGFKRT